MFFVISGFVIPYSLYKAQYELSHYNAAIADLDALEREVIARQHAAAQPKPHFYEIVPKKSPDSGN